MCAAIVNKLKVDRQRERQTDRQPDREAGRQADRRISMINKIGSFFKK